MADTRGTNERRTSLTRLSVITDWHTRDEDLPDVAPGEECERLFASQKFIVLHRVRVIGLTLAQLKIGTVEDVPFEQEEVEGAQRVYQLGNLDDEDLKRRLIGTGAAVARELIAVAPTLEIRVVLRNEGSAPVKPRAALIVQEELAR